MLAWMGGAKKRKLMKLQTKSRPAVSPRRAKHASKTNKLSGTTYEEQKRTFGRGIEPSAP
jgi:hypothetical protein